MILLLLLLLPAMDASSRGESRCRLVASVTIFLIYFLYYYEDADSRRERGEKGQYRARALCLSVLR